MSFLKGVKPNKPTASLEGYFISMLAKSKYGKTTFAVDLIREHYKGDMSKGLLLATEVGYKAIPDVHAIKITGFDVAKEDDGEQRGFTEVIEELIEYKNDIPYRFIIIDTITALERFAIQYVIRKSNRQDNPEKRYTDISDISWGKGYNMVAEEIYAQIELLKNAGFGVFVIGHEKTKEISTRDGFKYNYTGFNVGGKTSDIIEREADMIIYGDLMVEENEDGVITSTRRLRFRSDGNILCGTRFTNFPESVEHDAKVFLQAFESAILGLYSNDTKAVKSAQKEQIESSKERDKRSIENQKNTPEYLHKQINKKIKEIDEDKREQVVNIFKETLGIANYRKIDDVEKLSKAFKEISQL